MSNIETLEKILKEEFLPELEENLRELASYTQSWKATSEDKEEFEDLKEMKTYFDNVIEDLDNKNISEDNASEILEVLNEMRLDNENE